MPTFLDTRDLGNATEEQIKQAQNAPIDEFGVTHKNILYNKVENKAFCILDTPKRDAVEKTHHKLGMKCNWINKVRITKKKVYEAYLSPQLFFVIFLPQQEHPIRNSSFLIRKRVTEWGLSAY